MGELLLGISAGLVVSTSPRRARPYRSTSISTTNKNMPILLELFSGTGSMGRAFEARGWEVISVDIDPATACTMCMDVRDLTPRQLPAHPDLI